MGAVQACLQSYLNSFFAHPVPANSYVSIFWFCLPFLLWTICEYNLTVHCGKSDDLLRAIVFSNSLACYRVLVQSNPVDINHVIPWHGDVLGIKADLNQVDWVRFGLEHGADPNLNLIEEYKTPLAAAAECGNEEMVKLMLDYRTQAQGSGAIVLAAAGGHTSIVKLLLSNGADINETGIRGPPGDEWKDDMASPLHKAAANGHIKTIHFLIDAGANADIEDGQGRTPEAVAMAHG